MTGTRPRSQRAARRAIALAVVPVLTALGLSACSSSADSANTLVLYNAQHEQTTEALVSAFEKRTGIHVIVENNDEDVLTAQIEQEGSASKADVFFTENSNWLAQLDARHLLSKVTSSTLAQVPQRDSASNGDWLGVTARVACLVYNTSALTKSELPTSILQLADPTWKGKIEIAPAETDFWPVVASVQRSEGTAATLAWLRGLKANAGSNDNIPDNETITSDVSKGVADLGVINHYYFYRLEAEIGKSNVHAAISFFAPGDPGYVEGISTAGILKSGANQAGAQKFLAFMTSVAGQQIIAHSESFEYPLNPHVPPNPELTPLSSLHPNSFTPADLGTGLEAKKLLQEAGLFP